MAPRAKAPTLGILSLSRRMYLPGITSPRAATSWSVHPGIDWMPSADGNSGGSRSSGPVESGQAAERAARARRRSRCLITHLLS